MTNPTTNSTETAYTHRAPRGRDGTAALYDQIKASSRADLLGRYRYSVGHFDNRVFDLGDAQLDQPFEPDQSIGKWSIRTLLGHLGDTELVLTHRIRLVAAQPGSTLHLWDEHAYIDAGMYAPPGDGVPCAAPPKIGAFVANIYTQRQWIGEWLGTLNDGPWTHTGEHPMFGTVSLFDLVSFNLWHLEHHASFLNDKVSSLLGPPEACTQDGSCGRGGCGCAHDHDHEQG